MANEDDVKLPPGYSRETTIRRDAHGRWFHDGERVENDSVRRAFDRWIDRAEDGRFCLKNDVNWAYVEIEGSPLFVLGATIADDGSVQIALSDETTELLDPDTLQMDTDGALLCAARDGTFEAKFTNAAAFQIESLLDEDSRGLFLTIAGRRIDLAPR